MLDRLDAAFASQRRFVANASHELRTPLTVMRTAIDVTLAKPSRDPAQLESMALEVRQAVDGAEKLIDALLTLARSDRGPTGTEFVDLATAAEDAIDATAAHLAAADITVHSELHPAELHGDRVLLERMVANLVQNAARHNVPHGWIRLDTGHRDGQAWLIIANGGRSLPAAQFVRRVGHEPALAGERGVEPVEHAVERVGQFLQFVLRALEGDAVGGDHPRRQRRRARTARRRSGDHRDAPGNVRSRRADILVRSLDDLGTVTWTSGRRSRRSHVGGMSPFRCSCWSWA